MKRIVLIVAVVALCVAGTAAADSGGLIGSGTRSDDSGQVVGSGSATGQTLGSGGYLGSGTAVRQLPLFGGWSLLVVRSDKGTLLIPIKQ